MSPGPKVVVIGGGPCGMTLAGLLGVDDIPTMVVEREPAVLDFPRAVGIDDESLRTLQHLGVADVAARDMIPNTPVRYYSSDGHCFAHVKPSEQPFGWPRRNNFLQPLLEQTLREAVDRLPSVDARYGWELTDLVQDGDGVTVTIRDDHGQAHMVTADYVVGADGGRSTVRRLAGLQLTGSTAGSRWLVVDVKHDTLDAPFSAVHCHPENPVLIVALPYRHRRFEFKLQDGEKETDMVDPAAVAARLRPFYAGRDLPEIIRSRVYLHHSRVADSFQADRVFLAGDAAHLQPPFFGQGMNSGIRDATNLAWKLAGVVRGRMGGGALGSYDVERRKHATEMVWFATRIGKMYSPRNRLTEIGRDSVFRMVNRIPGIRDYILQMKYKPMPDYASGLVIPTSQKGSIVGRMSPQPLVEVAVGDRRRLDEVLGDWFAVVGIHCDPLVGLGADALEAWKSLGARFVSVRTPRSVGFEDRHLLVEASWAPTGAEVVSDIQGVFAEMLLARPSEEILVLRPDRYVMAACGRTELDAVTARITTLLGPEAPLGARPVDAADPKVTHLPD